MRFPHLFVFVLALERYAIARIHDNVSVGREGKEREGHNRNPCTGGTGANALFPCTFPALSAVRTSFQAEGSFTEPYEAVPRTATMCYTVSSGVYMCVCDCG